LVRRPDDGPVRAETCSFAHNKIMFDVNCFNVLLIRLSVYYPGHNYLDKTGLWINNNNKTTIIIIIIIIIKEGENYKNSCKDLELLAMISK
jgi:hypothetical protein